MYEMDGLLGMDFLKKFHIEFYRVTLPLIQGEKDKKNGVIKYELRGVICHLQFEK